VELGELEPGGRGAARGGGGHGGWPPAGKRPLRGRGPILGKPGERCKSSMARHETGDARHERRQLLVSRISCLVSLPEGGMDCQKYGTTCPSFFMLSNSSTYGVSRTGTRWTCPSAEQKLTTPACPLP